MLKIGQEAPEFTLSDKENRQISLSDFRGEKVVIYFYPKDDTPGCTKEACAFKDSYKEFVESNVKVIGISRDSIDSHFEFAKKFELPFILLSDSDSEVIKDYDVRSVFGAMRTTYIVDEEGLIEMVFEKANPGTNAADILEYLKK